MTAEARLVRAIGTRRLAAGVVNATIGAGIFVLPALVAGQAGATAPLAYVVCAAAMALVVTCFAAAGSRVSLTGGVYAYTEVAFGPLAGFVAGALYWVSATTAVASVASALLASIATTAPVLASGIPRAAALAVMLAGLAAINVRGVSGGARTVEGLTAAKLLPLVVLIAAGLFYAGPAGGEPLAPRPFTEIGRASVVLMFAFIGIEMALVPSGEVRDPARAVPHAVFAALAVTTTAYLLVQATAQRVLGAALPSYDAAPLAETGARLLGGPGRSLMLAGTAISMFGYLAGDILSTPRCLFAFARDRMLPGAVAAVHPRFHTPWVAIIVHALLVFALASSSSFAQLALLTNVVTLLLYFVCVMAAFELQRRDVRQGGDPFVLPGGALIPVLSGLVLVWLLSHATGAELRFASAVVAIAAVVFLVRRRALADAG
jgi:APA family basic amino acid/polyamine antiporter